MLFELVDSEVVMVCRLCGFQCKLGVLENPPDKVNLCPECRKRWKGSVMIKLKDASAVRPEDAATQKISIGNEEVLKNG